MKKLNSSFRLCVNYLAFNKVTVKNRFPLSLMTDLREKHNKVTVFTKLDIKNGYNLVWMSEKDECNYLVRLFKITGTGKMTT